MTDEPSSELKDLAVERLRRASDLVWRPTVHQGMFSHLELAEGELWPENWAAVALRSIPGLAQQVRTAVPDDYVAVDLNEDGYSTAFITCPCGGVHECEVGTVAVAECGRAFVWFGERVLTGRDETPD